MPKSGEHRVNQIDSFFRVRPSSQNIREGENVSFLEDGKLIKQEKRNGIVYEQVYVEQGQAQAAAKVGTSTGDVTNVVISGSSSGGGDVTGITAGNGLIGGGESGNITLNVGAGTGISVSSTEVSIDGTVATLTGTQTLTNKTLSGPKTTGDVLNTGNVSGNTYKYYHSPTDSLGNTAFTVSQSGDVNFAATVELTNSVFAADANDGPVVNFYNNRTNPDQVVKLGTIQFSAPVSGSAGDTSRLTAAYIEAKADSAFSSSNNQTNLIFYTANNATADETLRLNYDGSTTFNDAFTFPTADGSANQFLRTNGSGTVSWSNTLVSPTFTGTAQGANLTLTGDLTVGGTTITLNSQNLQVKDKNIVLNYLDGDASSTADGAGITIQDAVNSTTDATILWDNSSPTNSPGEFDFSHSINVTGNISLSGTVDGVDIAARDHDNVTLAGSLDYIELSGQEITRNAINLTTDVTGTLPVGSGGTGATTLTSNSLLTGNGTSAIQAESYLTFDGNHFEIENSSNGRGVQLNTNSEIKSLDGASWLHLQRYVDGNVAIGNNSNADLYVANQLGIGTQSPGALLDVNGTGYIRTAVFSDAFKPYSGTLATYGSSSSTDHYFVGDVGIGTSSPNTLLHLYSTGNTQLRLQTTGTGNASNVIYQNGSASYSVGINSAEQFSFYSSQLSGDAGFINTNGWLYWYNPILLTTNNTALKGRDSGGTVRDMLKIDANNDLVIGDSNLNDVYINQNVGIGTVSPSEKLHIYGSVDNDDVAVHIQNAFDDNSSATPPSAALTFATASNNAYLRVFGAPADTADNHKIELGSTAVSSYITFKPSNSEAMRIGSSGNVGINEGNRLYFDGTDLSLTQDTYIQSDTPDNLRLVVGNRNMIEMIEDDTQDMVVIGNGMTDVDFVVEDDAGVIVFKVDAGTSNTTVTGDLDVTGTLTAGTFNPTTVTTTNVIAENYKGTGGSNPTAFTVGPTNGNVEFLNNVDINGGNFTLAKSNGSILNLTTTESDIINNEPIGTIKFYATNETGTAANQLAASIVASASGTFDTSNNPTDMVFSLGETGTATEKMRIKSSGNVGIGTSSPQSKLNINVAAESAIPSAGNDTTFLMIGNDGSGTTNYGTMIGTLNTGNGYIQQQRFDGTATTYNLLLQPNGGNVGIGTSSPSNGLELYGAARNIYVTNTTEDAAGIIMQDAQDPGQNGKILYDSGSNEFSIQVHSGTGYIMDSTRQSEFVRDVGHAQNTVLVIKSDDSDGDQGASSTADIDFHIWDSNTRLSTPQARIGVVGDGTASQNSEAGGRLAFYTNVESYSSPSLTERMRIDASGNVGIGTSSPETLLHINEDDSAVAFKVTGGSGGAKIASFIRDVGVASPYAETYIHAGGADPQVTFRSSANQYFSMGIDLSASSFKISEHSSIGTDDRLTIDTSGNVGIGTNSPGALLDVAGDGKIQNDLWISTDLGELQFGVGKDGRLYSYNDDLYIDNQTQDQDIHLRVNDGGVYTTVLFIDGDTSRVGIGVDSPGSKLHVQNGATSYTWTPYAGTTAIFEGTGNNHSIVSIVGSTTGQSSIWFGDTDNQSIGRVRYEHANNQMEFWTNGAERMRIDSSGNLRLPFNGVNFYIGDSDELRLLQSGSNSYLYSYTNTLYVGAVTSNYDTNLRAQNSSGSWNALQVDSSAQYVRLPNDNWRLSIGLGNDLGLYHDATNSWIRNFTGNLYIRNDTHGGDIYMGAENNSGSIDYTFTLDGANRRIGIGNTSPTSKLHVRDATNISMDASGNGQVKVEGSGYSLGIALNGSGAHIYHNSSSRFLSLGTNETEQCRLTTGGAWHVVNDVVAYSSTPSDKKLKTNVKDIDYGLDTIMKLKPKQYDWKKDDRHDIGFIAQEVEEVIPEIVKDNEWFDDKIKTLDYEKLTAVLIKAVQEQQQQINKLEEQLNG